MLRVVLSLIVLFSALFSIAQERCGTVEYEKIRDQQRPSRETAEQFELWIKSKLAQKQNKSTSGRQASTNYTIPVVVHVIHNGETIGSGTNISDDQIKSQINVMNNDFQRLNADSTSTPDAFKPVAGKFPLTFVLAKQDPDGNASNGIVRVKGTQSSWGIADNYPLKALSYWPAEDYLNIWIVNLSGGLLGYTQLPTSSTLGGLQDFSIDRITDGVVIHYQAFGTVQDPNGSKFTLLTEYNLGRTATHEVGHFFGLRHVWGDTNSCDTTNSKDYVYDTPIQSINYNGSCPGSAQFNCGISSMYSNYMNYTDDACMNIFSKGQVNRMDVVINNSPRRASLLTSIGSQDPIPVADDLWLKTIMNPGAGTCAGNISPSLLVRNFGSNPISSCQIQLLVNGNSVETKTFSSLALTSGSQATLSFSPVAVVAGNTYKFSFKVVQTNTHTDGRYYNDTLSTISHVPVQMALPLTEEFNQVPVNWTILNPDGLQTWDLISTGGGNTAVYIDCFDYDDQGTTDWLISPLVDLTSVSYASINFDYAYSGLNGYNDRLKVLVTTSCDFINATEIFNMAGSDLITTTNSSTSALIPLPSDWATKTILLNQFLGQKIQIAFVVVNDWGNNIFLDKVTILNKKQPAFAIADLVSPSPVSCSTTSSPVVRIKNLGNTVIDTFTADFYLNNDLTVELASNAQLAIGSAKDFTFLPANLLNGTNDLKVVIKSPNGMTSGFGVKDSIATTRIVNDATDQIPLRQNFNGDFSKWISMSPNFGMSWVSSLTNSSKGNSMSFNAFGSDSSMLGKQGWLVSPTLDFSNVKKSIVFFETSYAKNSPYKESLRVFYSTDCGLHFSNELPMDPNNGLGDTTLTSSWHPDNDTHWTKRHVILDNLAGEKNVRLAFVATNGLGNNLYLDNIEFFVDDNEYPVSISGEYAVYNGSNRDAYVTFNFTDKQTVRLQICDITGNIINDQLLPDMLNQTFTLSSPYFPVGIYIIRIQTQRATTSTKVILGF